MDRCPPTNCAPADVPVIMAITPTLDANKDGSISRDEAKSAPRLAENFDAIDTNKDGTLTRDEMSAWRQANPRRAQPAPVKP